MDHDYAVGYEMSRRLSTHPAQRIADLTGCVVTKSHSGTWRMWATSFLSDSIINIKPFETWLVLKRNIPHVTISLPNDNRPWQESIYKPQLNVKNGGKDESTSAIG
jgi:hypothetical protein